MKQLDVESDDRAVFHKENVFSPTATTRLLARAAGSHLAIQGSILDLGCGSGVIGMDLALKGTGPVMLSMSDVSPTATALAKENARALGIEAEVRTGSLFDPWEGHSFDAIVSDVSGVIPQLGSEFGWFEGVSNESGPTGTDLAIQVLGQTPAHLRQGGKLLFPIISLSNERLILSAARKYFVEVRLLEEAKLPLPVSKANATTLVKSHPGIRLESIGGVVCFFSSAYLCEEPKGKNDQG